MKIYKAEKDIAHLIIENKSVSWIADICRSASVVEMNEELWAKTAYAREMAVYSEDLYPCSITYASTGWNKNQDVFLPEEMWAARNSVKGHPVNIEHSNTEIIGHIVSSEVVDRFGNVLPDDLFIDDLPHDFDIISHSLLYTDWTNPDRKKAVAEIISKIDELVMGASMECLFKDFDYSLAKDGAEQIVKRTKDTAYLTKYIKTFGGSGEYNGYKVGRVLRNISFVGKGVTEKPANARSSQFIKYDNSSLISLASNDFLINVVYASMEKNMSEENKPCECDQLKDALAKMQELEADTQAKAAKIQELEASLAEKSTSLASADEQVASLQKVLAEKETAFANQETSIQDLTARIEALEGEKVELASQVSAEKANFTTYARKVSLQLKGLTAEEAEKNVEKFKSLDESQWEAVAALLSPEKKPGKDPGDSIADQVNENHSTASIPGDESDEESKNREKMNEMKNKMRELINSRGTK